MDSVRGVLFTAIASVLFAAVLISAGALPPVSQTTRAATGWERQNPGISDQLVSVCAVSDRTVSLALVSPLKLNFSAPSPHRVGDKMSATFKIKNTGTKKVMIQRLKVAIRYGERNQDITGYSNFYLGAGSTYSFKATRTITRTGSYSAIPAVKYGGAWRTINNRNAVKFRVYPTFHFVMGRSTYPDNDQSMPAKAARFSDPSFSTALQRITEKKDGYQGPGIENEYSKMDPSNSDRTLLVLRGNTAAYYLYDPSECRLLRKISAFDECEFCEPEPRWDSTDPKLLYYICDTQLRSYDTSSNRSRVIHDFKKEFPQAAYVTTKSEGDASLDRRFWCFMVEGSGDSLMAVICYDRAEDRVVGRKSEGFPDSLNWVGMSMSGEHCIVGYEDRAIYTQVFSRDFQEAVKLPEGSAGHGDAALTKDGRDVYVYQNVRNDYICVADMATGGETKLLHIPFQVNPDIGMHVSGNCAGTPGWALVSTYGAEEPPPGKKHSWVDNQLFMLELKASPRVWRVAHTVSYTGRRENGEKNYFAEAFAAVNTAGTRVFWGSNWRDYRQDYSDAYQALLPRGWVERLPD